jgi:predicted phosphodiesterase
LADEEDLRFDEALAAADLLISCGDIPDPLILKAAGLARCKQIFAVKGNHDSSAAFPAPIVDLHLSVHSVGGLRFGGFNGAWRYKPRGHFLHEQSEVERSLNTFPAVDVFVAHNSPRLIHERDEDIHVGFVAFNNYIQRTKPRIMFHGHQHVNKETWLGTTRIVGVFGQKLVDLSQVL